MRLSRADLDLLARTEEVRIGTSLPGGPAHSTIVWVVVDGDEAFIRSYRGETAGWYREALANPCVTIDAGGRRISMRVEHASDPEAVARVSAGFLHKYAGDPATPEMVRAEILGTTLRLLPA